MNELRDGCAAVVLTLFLLLIHRVQQDEQTKGCRYRKGNLSGSTFSLILSLKTNIGISQTFPSIP